MLAEIIVELPLWFLIPIILLVIFSLGFLPCRRNGIDDYLCMLFAAFGMIIVPIWAVLGMISAEPNRETLAELWHDHPVRIYWANDIERK